MIKALISRLFGRKKNESDLEAMLRARQNERNQLGERIDRTRQEMERVIQDGVNLDGNAAQLNRERFRALSDRDKTDQRCFNMLTNTIAQIQTLLDMERESSRVDDLDHDTRICGELEDLERRQDLIELRTEALNRRTEQLAELQSRRDRLSCSDPDLGDEYARRVAEVRAAREKVSAAQPAANVDVPQAASVCADAAQAVNAANVYMDAAQTVNTANVRTDAAQTVNAANIYTDAAQAVTTANVHANAPQTTYTANVYADAPQTAYVANARSDAPQTAYAASIRTDAPQTTYAANVHANAPQTAPAAFIRSNAPQTVNAATAAFVRSDASQPPLTPTPVTQATNPVAPTSFFVPDAPDALAADRVPCGVCMHIDPAAALGLQFDETLT